MTTATVEKEKLPLEAIEERWRYIMATMIMGDLFVHEFLMMMSKRANPLIPTMRVMCVGTRIILEYNPIFMMKLTDEQVRWVLHHEVLHVALHHCTLRQPSDNTQQRLWNWAADLAINQLIKETAMVVRPSGDIKPLFPDQFGFEKLLSMEQYLQLLWKWSKENEDNQKNDQEEEDGGGQDGQGNGDQGQDGQDDGQGNNNGKGNKGGQNTPKAPGGGDTIDDHSAWEENDIMDQVVRTKIEQMLNQGKYWGTMSGEAKAAIEAAQKARVNWRRMLRHQFGRFAIEEKEPTITRPSRRFGYPYLGTTNLCVDRALVCRDTSLSISDKTLGQFSAECNKAKDHIPIDVVDFDTKICMGPVPYNKKLKRTEFHGRGGTNFQECFDLADKKRYKCVVILTDGEAPAPTRPKFVKDVIWCIVGSGKPPVDWGRVIRIKESALDI